MSSTTRLYVTVDGERVEDRTVTVSASQPEAGLYLALTLKPQYLPGLIEALRQAHQAATSPLVVPAHLRGGKPQ
jgi:hypothetical protein